MTEGYMTGRRLKLESLDGNELTEKLGRMTFEVEIVKQLQVRRLFRSQVVVVRIIDYENLTFVAKCFDPMLSPHVDPEEWPEGPSQQTAAARRTESSAYEALRQIQGVHVPRYYGHYRYISDLSYTAEAILLQFIDIPMLGSIQCNELTANEMLVLQTQILSLIDQFHNLRVYRLDLMNTYNIFWDRSNILMFCDFETAVVRDEDDDDDRYFNSVIYLDKAQVDTILRFLGKTESIIPEILLCIVPCLLN